MRQLQGAISPCTDPISESSHVVLDGLLSVKTGRKIMKAKIQFRKGAYCLTDRVTLENREKNFGYTVAENEGREYP